MKRVLQLIVLALIALTTWQSAVAQETSESQSLAIGKWGIGYRFVPTALAPYSGFYGDLSLSNAIALRFWINELFAVELGGWIYQFEDQWTSNKNTLLSAGALFKLSGNEHVDLYLAGRGANYTTTSKGRSYYCRYEGSDGGERVSDEPLPGKPSVPCYPWPSSSSRSTTLAIDGLLGMEWKPAPMIGVDFEFGYRYSQTVTTNEYPDPVPPPVEPPVPLKSVGAQAVETFASSVTFSIMQFEVILYF